MASDVGHVDILVNNAGLNVGADGRKPVHEFANDDWHRIIDVDLNGPFYCTQAFGRNMVERGEGGKIINIVSVVGIVPLRMQCAFAAAKAGLINLTKASALELAPDGINVNAIAPGSTLTKGTEKMFYSNRERAKASSPTSRSGVPGTPDDMLAYAALFLSRRGLQLHYRYSHGRRWRLDVRVQSRLVNAGSSRNHPD